MILKKIYQRLVSKNRSTKLKNDGRSQVDYKFFEHTIIKSFKTPSVVGGMNSFLENNFSLDKILKIFLQKEQHLLLLTNDIALLAQNLQQ